MQNRMLGMSRIFSFAIVFGIVAAASCTVAQKADRPWMNKSLTPAERAELVLKQLTLKEKLSLVHGNGMAHAPQ